AAHQEENFESFRFVFESRVRSTGHILALLSPWHNPQYLTRIWCVFELWVACERKDVTLEVIMSEEAEEQFHASLAASGMISVWKAFGCVQIQKAKASVLADRQNILRLVEPEATNDEDYDVSSKVQKLNEVLGEGGCENGACPDKDLENQVGESPSSTALVRKLGSSRPMTSQRQYLSTSFSSHGDPIVASVIAVAVAPVDRNLLDSTLNYQNLQPLL
ncbi:SWA2, partial [Symbiodinium sp. KB8]